MRLSLIQELDAFEAVFVTMIQFSEVLKQVQSVLAWASLEIQALLDGLVVDGIISELCGKNLSLQLYDGTVPDLVCMEASSKLECDELDGTDMNHLTCSTLTKKRWNRICRQGP